jgi:DNA-binding CsgD family transcriptional regulator
VYHAQCQREGTATSTRFAAQYKLWRARPDPCHPERSAEGAQSKEVVAIQNPRPSNTHDRESVRARISVAVDLAIGNVPMQAHRALEAMASVVASGDDEIVALYFQARAIAYIKARAIREGFAAFEGALAAARAHGEPALCARILVNYGTAAMQDGSIALAIGCLEEALATSRQIEATERLAQALQKAHALGSTVPFALVSLAEALFAAGELRRAATLLHELQAMRSSSSAHLLVAAAAGIPLGMMLADEALLEPSRDPSLLDLAFARPEQWLLGPLVESFCALYEHQGRRDEHDALLHRSLDSLSLLDNSLLLGIRAARLGPATHLPRISALMSQQCAAGTSRFLHAHQDVFESFLAARRQMPERSRKLGLQAAREFGSAGRPLLQALALEAAGLPGEGRRLRERCGAQVDAVRIVWSGGRIHKRLATLLTPREFEIARLAAKGTPNRAIATALDLSERTVHHHCESIFSKLGIRSRWQLSSALPVGSASQTV